MTSFIVLKVLSQLATPLGLFVSGLIAGGVLGFLKLRRLGRLIAAVAVLQLAILSFGIASDALLRPLEDEARREAAAAPACCYDVIVVLGGGVGPAIPPLQPHPDLFDGADRMWRAARLFHRGLAPRIVVSGGGFYTMQGRAPATRTEAQAMHDVLLALGVPDDRIVMEGRSLNTIENMRETRALVGTGKVALVTSGWHMPRSLRLARQAGLDAEAFPTDWRVVPGATPWWEYWLPSVGALLASTIALKEYLALAFDRRGATLETRP